MITACLAGILKGSRQFITLDSAATLIPYRACSFVSGSGIVGGLWDFSNTTLAELDFANESFAYGTSAFSAGAVSHAITADDGSNLYINSPYTASTTVNTEMTSAVSSDFDVTVDYAHQQDDGSVYANILLRFSDTDYIAVRAYKSAGWLSSLIWVKGGVRGFTSSISASVSGQLRLTRSGSTITGYWRASSIDAWTSVGSYDWTTTPSGYIGLYTGYRSSAGTVIYDNLQFNSGCPVDAQFKCVTSGEEYVDAGDGFNISKGDISAVTDGTLTVKEDINNTGTFDAYGTDSAWNNEDVAGNYPHTSSTGRYWWPLITMEGDGATFESLTYAKY